MDMITPVKFKNTQFKALLSFDLYDWAIVDAISTNERSIESLYIDFNTKRRLNLNVFPNGTLLHMIAEKANRDD